jgi:hypothetical protein
VRERPVADRRDAGRDLRDGRPHASGERAGPVEAGRGARRGRGEHRARDVEDREQLGVLARRRRAVVHEDRLCRGRPHERRDADERDHRDRERGPSGRVELQHARHAIAPPRGDEERRERQDDEERDERPGRRLEREVAHQPWPAGSPAAARWSFSPSPPPPPDRGVRCGRSTPSIRSRFAFGTAADGSVLIADRNASRLRPVNAAAFCSETWASS